MTPENAKKILEAGLKVNQKPNFSQASLDYMREIYGGIPIFLFKNLEKLKEYKSEGGVILKIDTSGLEIGKHIVVDIPTLTDYGAYYGDLEEGMYLLGRRWIPPGEEKFRDLTTDGYLYYDDLKSNANLIKKIIGITGTFAVLQNIGPERISIYKGWESLED